MEQREHTAPAGGFLEHNFMRLVRMEQDHAVIALEIVPESRNRYGALHGGAYYTMADNVGGAACRTDGRHYVTLQGGLNFMRAVRAGRVEASARVVHRGKTTCMTNVEITDQEGHLLAAGNFTYFCLGDQPPGGREQG